MEVISLLEKLNHRSKDRVRDMGEVFTPDRYVEEMLDLISNGDKKFWSDEDKVFFEPSCGHGNIVLAVYRRRLEAFYKKSLSIYSDDAAFYAVSNALNSLWAIDIDNENVNSTRTRVLHETLCFLIEKSSWKSQCDLVEDNLDFFAHILSAIRWHIYENETLSSLACDKRAEKAAKLTKAGSQWFNTNDHSPMDFELTWVTFYCDCEENNLEPLEYSKSLKFLEQALNGKGKKGVLPFADYLVETLSSTQSIRKKVG